MKIKISLIVREKLFPCLTVIAIIIGIASNWLPIPRGIFLIIVIGYAVIGIEYFLEKFEPNTKIHKLEKEGDKLISSIKENLHKGQKLYGHNKGRAKELKVLNDHFNFIVNTYLRLKESIVHSPKKELVKLMEDRLRYLQALDFETDRFADDIMEDIVIDHMPSPTDSEDLQAKKRKEIDKEYGWWFTRHEEAKITLDEIENRLKEQLK